MTIGKENEKSGKTDEAARRVKSSKVNIVRRKEDEKKKRSKVKRLPVE